MTLNRRLLLKGRPLDSITMRSHKYCIADRMMESSSTAYHIKRHRRHSKRLMTVCVELTNLVKNLKIDSEDWDIIGQRWSLMSSLTLSDAMPVDPWWLYLPGTKTSSLYNFFLAIWDVGDGRGWSYQPAFIQRTPIYLSHNWLLLQIGWSYPLEGEKDFWCD